MTTMGEWNAAQKRMNDRPTFTEAAQHLVEQTLLTAADALEEALPAIEEDERPGVEFAVRVLRRSAEDL